MTTLAEQVGTALRARGWTVAAAESCTGGLVVARLTDIPGSSAYVLGGVVAYAYSVKQTILGVKEDTLLHYGAVSEQTAVEMAIGVRRALGADLAVSITGIAGPGGGMADKPVGLTWLAIAGPNGLLRTERQVWPGDRAAVRAASADRALELLLQAAREDAP